MERKSKRMKKKGLMRLVSGVLATSMAFTLIPVGAVAASPEEPFAMQSEISLLAVDNVLTYEKLGSHAAEILKGTYLNSAQGTGWSYKPGEGGAAGTLIVEMAADFGDTYSLDCNVINKGRIEDGVFNGTVSNQGKIWGGEFYGTVVNETDNAMIGANGEPKDDLLFYGEVQLEKGSIYDGVFDGKVTGTGNGGKICGGTFKKAVTVHSPIEKGLFGQAVSVVGHDITGGFFKGDVKIDSGKILNGIFTGNVENVGGTSEKGIFVKKITGSGAPQESAYRHLHIDDTDCLVNGMLDTKDYPEIFVLGDWDFSVEYKGNHTVEKWLMNGKDAGSGDSLNMDSINSEPNTTLRPLFKLEFDQNGLPTTNGDKENLGWSYADGTLTFEKDFVFDEDTTVSCPVKNNGTIENGKFTGELTNDGTLKGGTYDGEVANEKNITGGTFNNTVKNNGSITGGTFNGEVINEQENGTIAGGEYTGTVKNDGTINNGTFTGNVENKADGTITDGKFEETVDNDGKIENGTFNNEVTNKGELAGGDFNKNVTNQGNGQISGGQYNDTVENNGQAITGGEFSNPPTGTTDEVNLVILTVPDNCTINETAQKEAVAIKGSEKSFTVNYLGTDFDDLKWAADGAELTDAKANPLTIVLKDSSVTLTLVEDKPEDSGNTGTTEKPGDSGNTGTTEKPGDSGNTGTTEKPGDSGNTGTTEKPGDSGNTGTTEKPSDVVKPDGTQSTGSSDGGFVIGSMIVGGVIVGGAVTAGLAAYSYMLDYIKATLPDGAVPQTRQQLAVALWQYAGQPEIAAEGIELGETEKAMRWVIENELIPAEGEYEDSVTDFEVLKAVNKTKKLLEKTQDTD